MKIVLTLAALCTVQFLGGIRAEDNFRSSYFNIRSEHRLVGHVITTTTADSELLCAHKCLALNGCKSGNFRTSKNELENCELSSRGLLSQTDDPDLVHDEEFAFISLKNEASLTTESAVTANGGWSEWGNWGPCNGSRTDGDLSPKYRQRTRKCTNPPPQKRGTECDGNSVDRELCCPSKPGLPGCFELSQLLPTTGPEGIAAFEINSEPFVAFASYYDDTLGYNTITQVYQLQEGNFTLNQTLDTFGARDIESFTINRDSFLAVSNHNDGRTKVLSTVVYRWEGGKFHVFQRIPTSGAWGVHYFAVSHRKFLVVTNYLSDVVSIYKWHNGSFSAIIQDIKITKPTICTTFDIDYDTYMACGSDVDHNATTVLKWNGTGYVSFQNLSSSNVQGSPHSFEANGSVFLAVPSYGSYSSYVYRWNGASFPLHQSLPITRAYSLESFIAENETFLALCSYASAKSDVYKLTDNTFTLYQQLPTKWATDLVSFTHRSRRYLAIAIYRNKNYDYNINSTVYIWT